MYIIQSMMIPIVVITYLTLHVPCSIYELSLYELIWNYIHWNTGTMQPVKSATKMYGEV